MSSNKIELYKDLKPKERIVKIIENHILPKVKFLGYSFLKSKMQLERKVGEFKQIIWFRTNSKNYKDEIVEFALHLKVENKEYSQIRKTFNYIPDYYHHNDPSNYAFIAESTNYIDEWDQKPKEYWFSFQEDDNLKIVDEIIRNIIITTDNFLNLNSDFKSSLNFRYNKFMNLDYFGFLWIPDILILSKLIGQKEIQLKIINKYNTQLLTIESKKDLDDDVEIYKIINNIINLL